MQVPPSPDATTLERLLRRLAPLRWAFRVELSGIENVPRAPGPLMFVGNHQLLALDSPFLMAEMWRAFGIPLRPLVDDWQFWLPAQARAVEQIGCVRATRENAEELLAQDAWLLVYPGGAREAVKADGHPYELSWCERLGFASLALKHRCTIVPVASRGLDGAVRVLLSSERIVASPLGPWLDRLGVRHDLLYPLVVPRRWPHLRFRLCEPIPIDHFMGHDLDTSRRRLRAEVGEAIQRGLEAMEQHPGPTAVPVRGPRGAPFGK